MRFNVKEWLQIYNEIKRTGKQLKDAQKRWDKENKKWIPAIKPMPEKEQEILREWIKNLLVRNNLYLDACGMFPKEPLWRFDIDDTKTWASHPDFIYGHLLHTKKYSKL